MSRPRARLRFSGVLRGERVTQPICLILAHLFQDRLAKLTEHAPHVDILIGAIAQHDLRIAPVAQCLQWQAVRALEPVDRTHPPPPGSGAGSPG